MTPASVLRAAAVQLSPGEDLAANRAAASAAVADAAERGARLVVLPEYAQFFHPDLAGHAPAAAEALDGPFATALQEVAAQVGAVVVAGLVEHTEDGGVANTLIAVDGADVLATYRKVHLYDAFGTHESDWLMAGEPDQTPVLDVDGLRIGLQTCYDLRFPESSRRLVDAGAEVLVVPAEWVRGPQKEHHWRTLLTARAIENTVHVIAADHAPPVGAGCSMILDPMGVTLASLGEQQGTAVADLDPQRTADVRRTNPSLANRRYRIIPR
ncbi:carbon-nitrogen hydrolase family protein [Brachybacterium hainanense]|uniref:Carbon-nitrogen hydrolase family protein n=1 Tax=Brachybacterium hainanense TaxID=1541174 RepID=A0ABV6R8R1_9MICO